MNKLIYAIALCMSVIPVTAQVKIGANPTTINSGAMLQVDANGTRGAFQLPRVALTGTADVTTVASPQAGFTVYNTATAGTAPANVIPGYYYYDGAQWLKILSSGSGWNTTGNAGTTAGTNFMGTTDDIDVAFKRNSVQSGLLNNALQNTSWGVSALNPATTGTHNTATGFLALTANNTGNNNTAAGYKSLTASTTGTANTATGNQSLMGNSTGSNNTALGSYCLQNNSSGDNNTGLGYGASYSNTIGTNNTSVGINALYSNSSGSYNVSVGANSQGGNLSGSYNTASGYLALNSNTVNNNNTGYGYQSLMAATGGNNTGIGYSSGANLSSGSNNIAIGAATNFASATASNQINIGNIIFGTGVSGSVAAPNGNIGISTAAPVATLHVNGSFAGGVTRVTTVAPYVIVTTDYILHFFFSGTITATLPAAASNTGRIIYFVNHATGVITTGTYRTANGTTSTTVAVGTQVALMSDGTEWFKVSN